MADIRVRVVRPASEGTWAFRDASLTWHPPGKHGLTAVFDPFPAYPHDPSSAGAAAARAAAVVPPLWDIDCYLADREETTRSNGHSNIREDGHYQDGEYVKGTPAGMILLSGKRVPPHPAVTRYLVAHEYGHHVAWMISHVRGARPFADTTGLERDYATVRGLPGTAVHDGQGGTWHDSACEIMACDFRVLILAAETEFWPHPGIPRPEDVPGLAGWWDTALAQVAGAAR